MVSQELIRVAILWHEMWHEGLEEASRLYFGDHNVEGMFTTLEPLHQMLERVRKGRDMEKEGLYFRFGGTRLTFFTPFLLALFFTFYINPLIHST